MPPKLPKMSLKQRTSATPVPPPKAPEPPKNKSADESDKIIALYAGKPGHNPFTYLKTVNDPTVKGYEEWAKENLPEPRPPRKQPDVQRLLQRERPYPADAVSDSDKLNTDTEDPK